MKVLIGLSIAMGLFFGLATFIIVAIIYGVAFALPIGLLGGVFFGVLLAIYMAIHDLITNKKYLNYKVDRISERIIYEASLFRLNGNRRDAGFLFLTNEMLVAVMVKGKAVLSEVKIPLTSIASISQKYDYGHLANALIIQKDGTETRFISDYNKLASNLRPLIGADVFSST